MLIPVAVVTAAIGVWAQGSSSPARNQIAPGDWPNLNRDLAATRFSPLTEINRTNVGSLKQAWNYRLGGGATSVPLVVGGVMYASSGPQVGALDADSGKEIWSYTVPAAAAATAAAAKSPTRQKNRTQDFTLGTRTKDPVASCAANLNQRAP